MSTSLDDPLRRFKRHTAGHFSNEQFASQISPFKTFVLALGFVLAPALACESEEERIAETRGHNVLLIVVDSLRADHLEVYGYAKPTSPKISAFADASFVFDGMYSQASWTKPSIASLFTSLYPPQHLVLDEGTDNQLANSLTTLAEVLRAAGYHTGAASQNPHVQANTGFDQGFDLFHGISGYKSGVDEMVRVGQQFLDESSGRPFFLYMHFLDPHGPYAPPETLRSEFIGGLQTKDKFIRQGRLGRLLEGESLVRPLEATDLEYLEALYDAEIRLVDRGVGEILKHLQGRGLAEKTLVIFTADHGEEFLDHGTVKHGYHLYEETTRIPLIIRLPGARPGRNAKAVVQHVDLMPTILDLLGLEGPGELQGRSLRPLLEDSSSESGGTAFIGTSWRGIERLAVRRGEWKLVRHEDQNRTELYHLSEDPREQNDVATDHPERVKSLLEAYRATTRPIEGVTPASASGPRDLQLEEQLKALGYIEDGDGRDR